MQASPPTASHAQQPKPPTVSPGSPSASLVNEEQLLDSAFVEEIPEEVKSQVLESSSALLACAEDTLSSGQALSSPDLQSSFPPACPIIEDPPLEESCESETEELEYVKVDELVARELEDLMAKLCRPSMAGEYRVGGVPGKSSSMFVPWDECSEVYEDETLITQHRRSL